MKEIWTAAILAITVASCERNEESGAVDPSAGAGDPVEESSQDPVTPDEGTGEDPAEGGEEPVLIEKKPPVAEPVPGQPGFVKSPYNGKIVDVKGIPAGSLVADPTYPAEEKKHFRVPEMPEVPVTPIEPPKLLDPTILINPGGKKEKPAVEPEPESPVEPEPAADEE